MNPTGRAVPHPESRISQRRCTQSDMSAGWRSGVHSGPNSARFARPQVFPRHMHDCFTVGVMLRGAGTLWYRGANRVTHRGNVVVIPPGEVHTGGVGRGTDVLSYLAVHVPADDVLDGQRILATLLRESRAGITPVPMVHGPPRCCTS